MIREPDGVDFVIRSEPLKPEGIAEIQEWIRKQREAETMAKPPLKVPPAKWGRTKQGRTARSRDVTDGSFCRR